MSIRSWLADRLLQRTRHLIPLSHRCWADAMRNEMAFVDERERLAFAAGCLWAGVIERLRTFKTSPVRLGLAAVMLLFIAADLFATALTAAYKLNSTRWAAALGSFTPGDDYRRLIPLMDAIPLWLHALMVVAAACYVWSMVRVLFRLRAPHVPVLIALVLEVLATQLNRPFVASAGVAANPKPSVVATVGPVVFPLALAFVLWMCARPDEPSLSN